MRWAGGGLSTVHHQDLHGRCVGEATEPTCYLSGCSSTILVLSVPPLSCPIHPRLSGACLRGRGSIYTLPTWGLCFLTRQQE